MSYYSISLRRLFVGAILIPLAFASLATILLLVQGGFGGGHGDLEMPIGLLGLPATFLLDQLPVPALIEKSDLLLVIWYPALLNLVFFWVPLACVGYELVRFWAWHRRAV